MVFGRVPEKRSYSSESWRIGDRRRIEFVRVPENKRKKASYPGDYRRRDSIRASIGEYQTDKESNSCEYRRIQDRNDGIRSKIDEELNPCEYRRIKERKHPIRVTTEEEILSGRVSENTKQIGNRICVSTRESKTEMMVSDRVPEKRSFSSDYRSVTDRQGINPFDSCKIQDIKNGIQASTREEIVFGRAPGNRRHTKNRILASIGE
ncbi:hypothetical protein PVL29_012010 [Vitis rotundifolia]|uniref:Uncharacterized protein n=1 Tax=Vitis rotundifolia TaxID=103349 RepID=A0AA39DQA1_VITRO|nr:hypothetical protein PVL29_012010 [Vitis rotundifolia]